MITHSKQSDSNTQIKLNETKKKKKKETEKKITTQIVRNKISHTEVRLSSAQ